MRKVPGWRLAADAIACGHEPVQPHRPRDRRRPGAAPRPHLRGGVVAQQPFRELSQTDAGHLLNALERGYGAIEAAATRLHQELMTEWVETFAAALHRDLIDAGDFRTAYSVKPRSNVS
jgi:hypothetical protein